MRNDNAILVEIERRFRERTPATRVDEVNASYRVGRGEMRAWCTANGFEWPEMDPEFQAKMTELYVHLRAEFPDDMWEPFGAHAIDNAKFYKIKVPRKYWAKDVR